MADEPSNAVIVAKLESLAEAFHASQLGNKEDHNRIFEQTSKTNGRVTQLEKTKSMLVGALIFVNVVIVPVVLMLLNSWLNPR